MKSLAELKRRAVDLIASYPTCECPAGVQAPRREQWGCLSLLACAACGGRVTYERKATPGSYQLEADPGARP